jgi:hypothetical protein
VALRDREHLVIALLVAAAFSVAIGGGILLPHEGHLPGVALGTTWLLYGLRALAIFYGLLLLVVPLLRALKGELPVELSMRGARYEESATASKTVEQLMLRVTAAEARIEEVGTLATRLSTLAIPAQDDEQHGLEN